MLMSYWTTCSFCTLEFRKSYNIDKKKNSWWIILGKALCLLSKSDLAERCSGAGDVIHNILQLLLREAFTHSGFPPSSPLTPRVPGLITPTSPFAGHWPLLNSSASETFPNLSHLISQTNSVTLSPSPSLDSANTSPKQNGGGIVVSSAASIPSLPPLYLSQVRNYIISLDNNKLNIFKEGHLLKISKTILWLLIGN